jgi:hypothetical protein
MPSSKPEPSQDLQYPPVHISHSLEELDLDTLIMRSTSRRLPQETGSTLEASTFEILSDSLIETSDDEAHTESIASTDDCTPDDSSDFSDDDVDYRADARDSQYRPTALHADALEQHESPSLHATEDSTLTEVPAHEGDGGDSPNIRLDEQPGEEEGVSRGVKVYRSFPDKAGFMYPVFEQYECAEVRLVIKGALSHASLPTPDSYRILYMGMPNKCDEDAITSKISAALKTCPSASRSIKSQAQLKLDACRCTATEIISEEYEPARIVLRLDDGQRLTFGPRNVSALENRPDLVVFCHPSAPRSLTDTREYASAREVFDRENVPYLELITTRAYGHGALSYDSKSLSMCMEGRNDLDDDFELKEVFPLDHYTFSELEPSQVNRHLALISPHMLRPAAKTPRSNRLSEAWRVYGKRTGVVPLSSVKALALFTMLTAMVASYIFSPVLVPLLLGPWTNNEAGLVAFTPYSSLVLSQSTPVAVASMAIPTSSPSSSPSSAKPASRGLTVLPAQVKPRKQNKTKEEKLHHFEVHTTTDHQFTLVPHKDLLNARKKPQLQIQVLRESAAVPIRCNRTISGVYVVDIEQEYPFGLFNVNIASYSKPLIRQTFEVALGHNKTKLAQFCEKAISNLVDTQQKVLDVSTSTAAELLASLPRIEAFANKWTHEVLESGQEAGDRMRGIKDVIARRANLRINFVKQIQAAAWTGIQETTAPIRTSSALWKFRLNAFRLQCMAEEAAGLSGIGSSGKESRACSKLRELS